MKETLWDQTATTCPRPPGLPVAAFEGFQPGIEARSALVWGEHCTECSFPTCQFTCEFYSPRADLTCRRFEAGIQRVSGTKATIYRIAFRKWGKLEAIGPVSLQRRIGSTLLDAADQAADFLLAGAPLPFRLRSNVIRRWNDAKGRIPGLDPEKARASFVVESWTEMAQPIPFTLTFLSTLDERMYQRPFTVSRRYDALIIPAAEIGAAIDLSAPYLVQIEPVGEAAGKHAFFGTLDFVVAAQVPAEMQAAASAPGGSAAKVKVVVWDLDNTLWDGTLGEDGIEGLVLRDSAIAAIQELDQRGILHSIASKNDEGEALRALDHFGLRAMFLAPQINWGPKSDSIRRIAAQLDLGIDSFVFIDDQAFERAEVADALPGLRVLPDTDAAALPAAPFCTVPATPESARRREMYQSEGRRAAAFDPTRTDYVAFVAGCDMTLELRPLDPDNAERVFELSQRTNQLNFRGTKLSRQDVRDLLDDQRRTNLVMRCEDRFGDYGIVGFATLDLDRPLLIDFFMSCRVQRKFVEHALFHHLLTETRQHGHDQLAALLRSTDRNQASAKLLEALGFRSDGLAGADGEAIWTRSTRSAIEHQDIVRVSTHAKNPADGS